MFSDLIPSQAGQVEHTSFLAARTGLQRRLLLKRQGDVSRFPMGILSIYLLLLRFSAEIPGRGGRTPAVLSAPLFSSVYDAV